MWVLTEDARLTCAHRTGVVGIGPSQSLVTIAGRRVLVQADPEGRPIGGCANIGPTIKPCLRTLAVRQGYSALLFIDSRPVCLDSVVGGTDGTPPGVVEYAVRDAGQQLVASSA